MKKVLLTATVCFSLHAFVSNAQTQHSCGTDEMKEYLIKNVPGYKAKVEAVEQQNAAEFQAYLNQQQHAKSSGAAVPTLTVPVVFHILHTNGPENVSDAACIAQLAQVNRDFARKGADTVNIDPLFEPLYVNSRISFVLAKKDPQGNCTTGIVHHYDENTQWSQDNSRYLYQYSGIGTGKWHRNNYLNIYVVAKILGDIQPGLSIGGYTYKPGTAPNIAADAIVLAISELGNRSLSHEIGHWLGLAHVFDGNGGFRNPASTNNTPPYGMGFKCGNDDIADTPKTPGFSSTCPNYITLSDSCDPGKRPNLHNIMDYGSCPMMFTQGQTDKMRFSLNSNVANRSNLSTNRNLARTGILSQTITINTTTGDTTFTYGPALTAPCAPIADFYANKARTCQGQTIIYNSTSYNYTTTAGLTYSWVFEGGTPLTSTLTAPTVTYSTPGNYSTTLTISNGTVTSTKVRTPFPGVSWQVNQASFPASEGFETSAALPTGWSITNKEFGTLTWEYGNYGSNSGRCMVLPNANGGQAVPGDIDILETPQYNFSNTTNLSISYDYSYARKPLATGDVFRFEYSTDCGGTWSLVPGTPTVTVMSASGGTLTAPYIPYSQNKWVTQTHGPIPLISLNNKPNVKFRFVFQNTTMANAQNLYLDNFNISGTVGLEELENSIGLSVYPNPTSSSSTVEFISPVNARVGVAVFDVTGRLVEESKFDAVAGDLTKYQVNKNAVLNPGIYFVSLTLNQQKITKKLIVE